MDIQIANALRASLQEYGLASSLEIAPLKERLDAVFNADDAYLEKVDLLDQVFDDFPHFEELREVYFDLLLMNFFSFDISKLEGDYLESPEWEKIEDQTLERGTELLNLLLYLRECADEKIDPSLEDYLKEFLLVNDDEFQDEHRIYEPMIENQALVDSTYPEIARVAKSIDPESELKDLFYPIVSFFNENEPTEVQFKEYIDASTNASLDAAIFALIIAFNQHK